MFLYHLNLFVTHAEKVILQFSRCKSFAVKTFYSIQFKLETFGKIFRPSSKLTDTEKVVWTLVVTQSMRANRTVVRLQDQTNKESVTGHCYGDSQFDQDNVTANRQQIIRTNH